MENNHRLSWLYRMTGKPFEISDLLHKASYEGMRYVAPSFSVHICPRECSSDGFVARLDLFCHALRGLNSLQFQKEFVAKGDGRNLDALRTELLDVFDYIEDRASELGLKCRPFRYKGSLNLPTGFLETD